MAARTTTDILLPTVVLLTHHPQDLPLAFSTRMRYQDQSVVACMSFHETQGNNPESAAVGGSSP